jgi:hypothetical protein
MDASIVRFDALCEVSAQLRVCIGVVNNRSLARSSA